MVFYVALIALAVRRLPCKAGFMDWSKRTFRVYADGSAGIPKIRLAIFGHGNIDETPGGRPPHADHKA